MINNILNPPPPEALNLDEAPTEIRAKKAELKYKLSQGTFTWDDMDNFTIFSEYVAANQYEAQSIITGWTITAVLEIIDTGYLWFVAKNDVLDLKALPDPPLTPQLLSPTASRACLRLDERDGCTHGCLRADR